MNLKLKHAAAIVFAGTVWALAASASAQQSATFTIEGLVLGPGDQNGLEWDGSGRVGQDQMDTIQAELVTNAIGQIVSTVNPAAIVAGAGFLYGAPDATGTCTLRTASGQVERRIATEDTYNPSSASQGSEHIDVEWTIDNYVVGQAVLIECDLYDEDFMDHDRIGRFVLDSAQLQAVLDEGGRSVFFDTRQETRNALLAVEISAFGPMSTAVGTGSSTTPDNPELPADRPVDETARKP